MFVFIPIFLLTALASSAPLPSLNQTIQTALQKTGAPGLAIGTLQAGKTSIAVAGVRRAGSTPTIQTSDKWHMGSITKSMTATLIARLAEKGMLSFDDTVGEVLSKLMPDIHPAYKNVTYRQLVTHRAGLRRDFFFWLNIVLQGTVGTRDVMKDRILVSRLMLRKRPINTPGTSFNYSNVGYIVAGTMIEVTTGIQWETLIQREVFIPLEMRSAGFGAPGPGGIITQPRGHLRLPWGKLYPLEPSMIADNIPAMGPAGRVHANVGDMLKYLAVHMREAEEFLARESWMVLHTAPEGDYAWGWGVWSIGNRTVLLHSGSNALWYALVAFSKELGAAIVLTANYAGAEVPPVFNEITRVFFAGIQ